MFCPPFEGRSGGFPPVLCLCPLGTTLFKLYLVNNVGEPALALIILCCHAQEALRSCAGGSPTLFTLYLVNNVGEPALALIFLCCHAQEALRSCAGGVPYIVYTLSWGGGQNLEKKNIIFMFQAIWS